LEIDVPLPTPTVTPLNGPYWAGLAQGELRFQRCAPCDHAWLPPREECPRCLAADWRWDVAAGRGKVVSWVVYHHAFHDALADRLPYNVALVELDEGPRLITNITGDVEDLGVGRRVRLRVEREEEVPVARFTPT
jgi:uncharacterized OB-fold protein